MAFMAQFPHFAQSSHFYSFFSTFSHRGRSAKARENKRMKPMNLKFPKPTHTHYLFAKLAAKIVQKNANL